MEKRRILRADLPKIGTVAAPVAPKEVLVTGSLTQVMGRPVQAS
jgi:hypothetical protein